MNNVELRENLEDSQLRDQVPFPLLEGEILKYLTISSRQNLSIRLIDGDNEVQIAAKDGNIYLTNFRLVYVTESQGDINTFQLDVREAPLLRFSHKLVSPWFGANYWEFLFHSTKSTTSSDGLPLQRWFKGTIKFLDGGVFDFVKAFDYVFNDIINNPGIDEELPRYENIERNGY